MEDERPAHAEQAEEAERQAEALAHEGDRVDQHIDEAREDWEAKQDASDVPGAVPDPGEEDETGMAAQSGHGEEAEEAGQ